MYEGKSLKLFRKFAVPQMIGLLFNSVYVIVDGVFIGNCLGRNSMAAAAVAVPFIEILVALSMAVASGAGIIISEKLGRKETKAARQTLGQSTLILFFIGALIVILGNVFIYPLANLLGATELIQAEALIYLKYIICFSPFLLFSFLLGALVRNDGKPKLAMCALTFGAISNIVLDYVFMYPLNMGIAGAALATTLGPIFSVLILAPHFLFKQGNLYFEKFNFHLNDAKQIIILGFPSFIMEFTIGIITFLYNFAIIKNNFGEIGLAAYLIIGYLMLIILTVFLGLAEGLQPIFSYFNGTSDFARSKELLLLAIKIFLTIGILCYLAILLFSHSFILLFAPNDPMLVQFTHDRCIIYFFGFFLAGLNILMIIYWQSTKKINQALIISLLRSVIITPTLIIILPIVFSNEAIWFCHSLSEIVTFCFTFYLFTNHRIND